VTQQLFDYLADMSFESYLQYVYIPNLRVVNVKNDELEKELWWDSHSRKDYVYIFRWLKKTKNVQRILSIVVEDDPVNFHSDEAIEEAVKGFDIEVWNWVKLDMCSDTILAAAENVRDLSLYWSGNKAVLKSWAALDGLARLGKVISYHSLWTAVFSMKIVYSSQRLTLRFIQVETIRILAPEVWHSSTLSFCLKQRLTSSY
jgi:hypothetical protein